MSRFKNSKVPCPEGDCSNLKGPYSVRCNQCASKVRGLSLRGTNNPNHKTGSHLNGGGYVVVTGLHDHPNAYKGRIYEHKLIMTQMLGRSLVKGESIHHKNGVKDDNRPENLELWSSSQPAGQRIDDKIQYALCILELYAPHLLAK